MVLLEMVARAVRAVETCEELAGVAAGEDEVAQQALSELAVLELTRPRGVESRAGWWDSTRSLPCWPNLLRRLAAVRAREAAAVTADTS